MKYAIFLGGSGLDFGGCYAMIQLVYESEATAQFREDDLPELIRVSRQSNHRRDVTGMLIYHDRRFIQILEGPEENVHALYAHIEKDPRHDEVWRLAEMTVQTRSFEQWTMGWMSKSRAPRELAPYLDDVVELTETVRRLSSRNPKSGAAYCGRLLRGFCRRYSDLELA